MGNMPTMGVDPDGEFLHIVIGTAGGGLGAAGGGGFAVGFVGGAVGSAVSMPIQNVGNHLYFDDPLMMPKEYATGVLVGGALGGTVNGGIAAFKGTDFWNGYLVPKPTPTSHSDFKKSDRSSLFVLILGHSFSFQVIFTIC